MNEIRHNIGVIPQVLPSRISSSLYRMKTNVQSARLLGIVGAGGIGFILHGSISAFEQDKVSAIILVVIVAVSIIDIVSRQLRKLVV